MNVIFDVKHLYYLPQYLPVYAELKTRNVECIFLFYKTDSKDIDTVNKKVIENENLYAHWANTWQDALDYFTNIKADWIVFGNSVDDLEQIHTISKTVLMQHGIGPKSCYYDVSNNGTTVRFVEGQHRLKRLQTLYPNSNFVDTGYAKLDPAFVNSKVGATVNTVEKLKLEDLQLDPNKKTILYAPTFYPSSIERFDLDFALQFSDYNIILKAHHFSITKSKYAKQLNRLKHWNQSNNVYLASLEEYNLLDFMNLADVLVSDASSAIFEFAALDKPVVWCDFYKLRWSYSGLFKFRLRKRLDPDIEYFETLTDKSQDYASLKQIVDSACANPEQKKQQRRAITLQLAGITDGRCSTRICDYLESNQ